MSDLTFSKKIEKKTLNARKRPLKSIRNTLSSKSSDYWPVLKNQDDLINELLNTVMTKIKPLKETGKVNFTENEHPKKCLLFGIKEITKSIQNKQCAVLLIDASTPRILVSHLICMAVDQQIPVACLTGLQNIILDKIGFKSSTICFKRNTMADCNEFIKMIKNNTCYDAVSNNLSETTLPPDDMQNISQDDIKITEPIYLLRTNKKERIFCPPTQIEIKNTEICSQSKLNFIKINKLKQIQSNQKNHNLKKHKKFNPLQIKRIRNNANRNKKVTKS